MFCVIVVFDSLMRLRRAFEFIKVFTTRSIIDPIRCLHSLNLKCDGMFSLKSKASLMKLSEQSFRFHLLIEKMIIHLDPVKATTTKSKLNQRIMQCEGLLGIRSEMIGQKQARND